MSVFRIILSGVAAALCVAAPGTAEAASNSSRGASPQLVERAAQARGRIVRRGEAQASGSSQNLRSRTTGPTVSTTAGRRSSARTASSSPQLRRTDPCTGVFQTNDQSHRQNFPDPKTNPAPARVGAYPWHFDITATYFYIGERPTQNNPTPNTASSWDSAWDDNYGGYDDPNPANRCPRTYAPLAFTPRLNPFYVALPYNDIQRGGPKPEAERVIPWYRRDKQGRYESVCRGTWVQIYYNGRYCFAQWEDCGPFVTDDWQYVFGNARPKNTSNRGAGIDISPAVRDYLGIQGGMAVVHWRFVDFSLVPGGPWARFGKDNPFVNRELRDSIRRQQQQRLRRSGSGARNRRASR